jgi:hypothetical protein
MNVLIEALNRLLASEKPLNASSFSANQRKALEQFAKNTRIIEIRKQSRSTIFQILNRESVLAFLAIQKPVETVPKNIPIRSQNIGLQRDSKKGKSTHEACYLLMKSWNNSAFFENENTIFKPANLTKEFGVAALKIEKNQTWTTQSTLFLVENQALFDSPNWLPENFGGCLIYYAGQLSGILLDWFAEQKRAETVILFPDYDGVGLSNYVRLAQSLHDDSTLEFYWMPNWEMKLALFGNAEIWQNTRVQFENAFEKLAAMNFLTADFVKLGDLSQYHGKTLEQEAIWL